MAREADQRTGLARPGAKGEPSGPMVEHPGRRGCGGLAWRALPGPSLVERHAMSIYSEAEREKILRRMQEASGVFYALAIQTGCHTFIEFCGLMNKFIDICREQSQAGKDFTEASRHSDAVMEIEDHHVAYLFEKLDCIFGNNVPEVREVYERLTARHGGQPPMAGGAP